MLDFLILSDQFGDGKRYVLTSFHPLPTHPPYAQTSTKLTHKTVQEKKKSKKSKSKGSANAGAAMAAMTGQPAPAQATTTGAAPQMNTAAPTQRNMTPRVEEVFDE